MRTTIDKAGRVVLPKALRAAVGLEAGEVEVTVDGSGLRVESIAPRGLARERGRPVIPATGSVIDAALVDGLRRGDQR